ncbi:MAG: BPSS1780 family membrane protein [Pseudomonadota bacterium]
MSEELPRRVPARAGIDWVTGAFRLFIKSPLMLGAATAVFLGLLLILQFIPYAGAGLSEIVTPLIVAGFMRAFRSIDEGSEPELPQLAAGFRSHAAPLATVGAIYLGLLLAILSLMKFLGLDYQAMLQAMQQGATPEQLAHDLEGKAHIMLLGPALAIPAVAATWYAPALVLFGNAGPLQAMGLSLKACARNWLALLVNGVALIPLLLLAMIPVVGMLVAVPVMLGTAYLGYQAMFASRE